MSSASDPLYFYPVRMHGRMGCSRFALALSVSSLAVPVCRAAQQDTSSRLVPQQLPFTVTTFGRARGKPTKLIHTLKHSLRSTGRRTPPVRGNCVSGFTGLSTKFQCVDSLLCDSYNIHRQAIISSSLLNCLVLRLTTFASVEC